jgi:hypothetical protein
VCREQSVNKLAAFQGQITEIPGPTEPTGPVNKGRTKP